MSTVPSPAADQGYSSLPPEAIAYARQFFDASRKGDVEVFSEPLKKGLPPNLKNEKGDTFLMLATYHGHAPLVKLLLQHAADPNIVNDKNQSPIAGAIFKNEVECTELLVRGGADLDLGTPSARDTAKIFGSAEKWERRWSEWTKAL